MSKRVILISHIILVRSHFFVRGCWAEYSYTKIRICSNTCIFCNLYAEILVLPINVYSNIHISSKCVYSAQHPRQKSWFFATKTWFLIWKFLKRRFLFSPKIHICNIKVNKFHCFVMTSNILFLSFSTFMDLCLELKRWRMSECLKIFATFDDFSMYYPYVLDRIWYKIRTAVMQQVLSWHCISSHLKYREPHK